MVRGRMPVPENALRERGIGVMFEKEAVDTRTMNSELILAFQFGLLPIRVRVHQRQCPLGAAESLRERHYPNRPQPVRIPPGEGRPCAGRRGKGSCHPPDRTVVPGRDSLYTIVDKLAQRHIPSPKGKDTWSAATLRSLLTNEKYKGDALLQKTYRPSLFSDRAVQNDGDLPKYYVEGVLPRILEPEVFDRVQEELAKRSAKRPISEKAKTPFGRYSGKYALSTLVVCGKCGALYRRVTWYRKGEKQIMWRCGTRLDGKANCPDSPHLGRKQTPIRRHGGHLKTIHPPG